MSMDASNSQSPALEHARARAGTAAAALWAQAQGRRVAAELREAGIHAIVLKGPELQARLYGTPAAYPSGDLDVLIRPSDSGRVRSLLESRGWRFVPENGVLWRWSAAASYERDGFLLDLHWGIHAAHLPAFTLRALEKALWEDARPGEGGFLEPAPEALFVFLAVHVVGHDFERPQWSENVQAAENLVRDWRRVNQIAAQARVSCAVRAAREGRPQGTQVVLLDGALGGAVWWTTWLLRGHFIPAPARNAVRTAVASAREGFGLTALTGHESAEFAGLRVRVPRGVFPPKRVTERLLDAGMSAIASVVAPTVVEVGTGSGALALALAQGRPDARVIATDISARAVSAAKRNRDSLRIPNVYVVLGDLLDPVPGAIRGQVDLILVNLPYVPRELANRVGDWGAPLSTVSGPDADGLGLFRRFLGQASQVLRPGGHLALQMIRWQWDGFAMELEHAGFVPLSNDDVPLGHAMIGMARYGGTER